MNGAVEYEYDLVVLVADKDMEHAIRTVVHERSRDGGFRRPRLLLPHQERQMLVDTQGKDAGVLRRAHELLRPFSRRCQHALVLFDRQGCGREEATAAVLEQEVRDRLRINGWDDRGEVVVLDPELENWIWNGDPAVDACLCWSGRNPPLRHWLDEQGLWPLEQPKPGDPKSAYRRAIREAGKKPSAAVFEDIARRAPLVPCRDRAFRRFLEILRRWFPPR